MGALPKSPASLGFSCQNPPAPAPLLHKLKSQTRGTLGGGRVAGRVVGKPMRKQKQPNLSLKPGAKMYWKPILQTPPKKGCRHISETLHTQLRKRSPRIRPPPPQIICAPSIKYHCRDGRQKTPKNPRMKPLAYRSSSCLTIMSSEEAEE